MNIEDFKKDMFAKHNKINLVEMDSGYAKTQMHINKEHLNGLGNVHGGAIFTLADFAFAVACNSGDCIAVGINADISYIRVPKGKKLTAIAKEKSIQKSIGLYVVDVLDEDGTLIATFKGTAYRKRT